MNEQIEFIQAIERLYASVHRLRDVTYADNWDNDLPRAWLDFQTKVNEIIPIHGRLS